MPRRRTTSIQRWNNVAYINLEIWNVEQRRINVDYFNVYSNNIRLRRNSAVIFNVDFHNVGQRWNNVVNMIIWKNKSINPGLIPAITVNVGNSS